MPEQLQDPITLGAILGGLNGAIVWLARQLLAAKDAEIGRLEKHIEGMNADLDFLRDVALRYMIDPASLPPSPPPPRRSRGSGTGD